MSEYLESSIALTQAVPGASRERSPGRVLTSGAVSYGLLLLFLFLLYSQLPQLVPALGVLRLELAVGGTAILALAIERLSGRRGWDFVSPESYLLLGFVGFAGLSCFGALWPGYAAENTLELAKMAALYFLMVNCINTRRQFRGAVWLMALGGLFPAVGTLGNYFRGDLQEGRARWVGIFANSNELAYSLVILVPLAAYLASDSRSWKAVLLWMIIALYVAATCVSFSRGGMLGLLAVVALLGLRSKRAILQLLMLVVLAASLIFMLFGWSRSAGFTDLEEDSTVRSRLVTVEGGLAMFADHPLTGVGIGCSIIAWPLYAPPDMRGRWLIIHNTFVQALSETGIGGFVCFTLLLGAAIGDARRIAHHPPPGAAMESPSQLATSLEISLWGFAVCALSGGFVLTWFPYLLTGLVSSLKKLAQESSNRAGGFCPTAERTFGIDKIKRAYV